MSFVIDFVLIATALIGGIAALYFIALWDDKTNRSRVSVPLFRSRARVGRHSVAAASIEHQFG